MSIARMSMIHNSNRYFTITVNEYEAQCMKGVIYHAGKTPGIRYSNFLEMVIHMNRVFDQMSCPKQTMELRRFSNTDYPVVEEQRCDRFERGTLASFQIYVGFRYNASWQGRIKWLDGNQSESFESLLQMLQLVDRILTGDKEEKTAGRRTGICQLAVDSYDRGLITGSVQNAFINYMEDFRGSIGLAETISHFVELGINQEDVNGQPQDNRIVTEETWELYRKGGRKTTFLIQILFREHSTWQGIICWRESGERQAFRSFFEMMFLIASASESLSDELRREDGCAVEARELISVSV